MYNTIKGRLCYLINDVLMSIRKCVERGLEVFNRVSCKKGQLTISHDNMITTRTLNTYI